MTFVVDVVIKTSYKRNQGGRQTPQNTDAKDKTMTNPTISRRAELKARFAARRIEIAAAQEKGRSMRKVITWWARAEFTPAS